MTNAGRLQGALPSCMRSMTCDIYTCTWAFHTRQLDVTAATKLRPLPVDIARTDVEVPRYRWRRPSIQ